LLLVPEQTTAAPAGRMIERIREHWTAGPVASSLEGQPPGELVVVISDASAGSCATALGDLARRAEMRGKLLAGWCLVGSVRDDLPGQWLAEGQLSGIGLAETSVVELRHAESALNEINAALAGGFSARIETLPGPFLWFF